MEDTESKILELTQVELNDFFKNLGVFFVFLSGVATFILSFLSGALFFILVFFLLLILGSFGKFLLTGNGDMSSVSSFFGYFFFPCIFIAEAYGFRILKKIGDSLNILEYIRNASIELYRTYKKTIQRTEGVEEILTLLESIQKNLFSIKKLLWFRFLFSKSGKEKLRKLLSLVVQIALETIQDLKQNLSDGLKSKQRDSSEAIANLHLDLYGNDQLKDVTLTQSLRLDEQRKQFEKLQDILIKI